MVQHHKSVLAATGVDAPTEAVPDSSPAVFDDTAASQGVETASLVGAGERTQAASNIALEEATPPQLSTSSAMDKASEDINHSRRWIAV